MRTTVTIDDDVLRAAKVRAAAEETTLSALVPRVLRDDATAHGPTRRWLMERLDAEGLVGLPVTTVLGYLRIATLLRSLLLAADARGDLVPDGHLAALARQHGASLAPRDRGLARFPGIRLVDPAAT